MGENGLLGAAHAGQNGRLAMIVTVYADAEIDLGRIGVRTIGGHEAENWISGKTGQMLEHHGSPAPRGRRGGFQCTRSGMRLGGTQAKLG